MRILFYINIPSPYRVAFFNELGKYCELTVLFEMDGSMERDDSWREYNFDNFKGIILKGVRTRKDSTFCPGIIRYLRDKRYDHIVITQLSSITAIWAVTYLRLKGMRYCYEGDGGFIGNIKGIKAKIKRFIIGNAAYCFSTSQTFNEYCIAYGAEKEKIYWYPFTSVFERDILPRPLTGEEKAEFKKMLGMKEELAILSIGQFIPRKGFDLLIEMSRFLPPNVGVYIVGGQATPEYLEMKEKWSLKRVHFLDFMKKELLADYYKAADLFVFPTREDIWGLVVNEAFANGLPVVSTDKCVAAMEMIIPGENGYIIPVEDITKMRQAVEAILNSKELQEKMKWQALKTIRENYTIENMAREHIKVFRKNG